MTVAISEILKQVAFLSPAEQKELTARLTEQVGQNAEAMPMNGPMNGESPYLNDQQEAMTTNEDNWWDVSTLNHVPPKWTRTARARFVYVGRAEPLPYYFSDFINDEEDADLEG